MADKQNVRFIRKNGRIIPIRTNQVSISVKEKPRGVVERATDAGKVGGIMGGVFGLLAGSTAVTNLDEALAMGHAAKVHNAMRTRGNIIGVGPTPRVGNKLAAAYMVGGTLLGAAALGTGFAALGALVGSRKKYEYTVSPVSKTGKIVGWKKKGDLVPVNKAGKKL